MEIGCGLCLFIEIEQQKDSKGDMRLTFADSIVTNGADIFSLQELSDS